MKEEVAACKEACQKTDATVGKVAKQFEEIRVAFDELRKSNTEAFESVRRDIENEIDSNLLFQLEAKLDILIQRMDGKLITQQSTVSKVTDSLAQGPEEALGRSLARKFGSNMLIAHSHFRACQSPLVRRRSFESASRNDRDS